MKKLSTAVFCVIYCLSIIGGMFAVAPVAVAEESAAPERVGEVLTLREKNSDTYLLEDGSYECVVYSRDKYYESEYGRLEEIDNTVVAAEYSAKSESYAYANKAGGVNYRFADNKAAVSIDTGNAAIAFSVSGGRGTTAKAGGDSKTVFEDYKLSGENYISYAGVAEGTDLVYAVKTGYLKEYIIMDYYHTEGIGNGLQRTTPTFFSLDKAGDTISKCATLPFNTYTYTKNVRIDYIDDYDYFSFTPTVSDNYHFSVSHSGNDCFWLKVYNSYGVQIASQTGMSHPELDVYLSNNTTYYIMVKNDEDYASAVMNYQLIYVRDY